MRKGWQIVLIVAVLTVATGVLSPAIAGEEPLARVSAGTASVEWLAAGGYERLILTVSSPDGTVLRREFRADQTPSFSLFDAQGARRPDGSYTWELQAVPKVAKWVKDKVAAAREAGDDAALEALRKSGRLPQGKVQAGVFSVADGSIVASGPSEEPANKPRAQKAAAGSGLTPTTEADQVIPDDLIVQGSGCFGFDCVNNESFGFDTIRMKENNTRIKFEDTSVGTYPTNDWQLTANDSASGGASKFSIEDITGAKVPFTITAGASTNSIFVDSTGRVGFRTSTPVLDLHVATSNTPAIRLEQNNSGGFTAQTWDIGANEANFFVRDVTGGSRLPLRIRPGAPTSSVDISADGDVGIGTASPDVRLDVTTDSATTGVIRMTSTSATGFPGLEIFNESGTQTGYFGGENTGDTIRINAIANNPFVILTNSTERIRFPAPGGNVITAANGAFLSAGGVWTNASSRELKQDVAELSAEQAVGTLKSLSPVTYAYKADPNEHHVGFIAEDVPDLVAENNRKGLSPMDVVAVLTKVVQEQQKTIDELSTRLAELESEKK
jgi:Chaperone of endosialidase